MTPAEVEALLALPEDVRAELRDGRGPGWACFPGPHAVPQMRPQPTYAAWLPADTVEMLNAGRRLADSREAFLESVGDGWYQAGVKVSGDGGHSLVSARAESARLAALRLLAAIVKTLLTPEPSDGR